MSDPYPTCEGLMRDDAPDVVGRAVGSDHGQHLCLFLFL